MVRKNSLQDSVLDAGEQGTFMKMKEGVVRFRFLMCFAFLFEQRGCRNIWLEFNSNSDTITTIEV